VGSSRTSPVSVERILIEEARLRESQVLAARATVRRGIRRGDVPDDTSVTLLLDTLCGGVLMHVLTTPAHLRDRLVADADGYASGIVDFLLRSVLPTG